MKHAFRRKEKKQEKVRRVGAAEMENKDNLNHLLLLAGLVVLVAIIGYPHLFPIKYNANTAETEGSVSEKNDPPPPPPKPTLNKADYDARVLALANRPVPPVAATSTASSTASSSIPEKPIHYLWPAENDVYPNVGAILPFYRVVAYYGNFYSKNMGVLGEYPADQMISKLDNEVQKWEAADPNTPVMPAIEYIAITAQGSPGPDGDYNLHMPDDQIDHAIDLANQVNGIVILDVQVGLANLQTEIESLEPYLKMPKVHLAIDPEFRMKYGHKPGEYIGTVDAADVNRAAEYLAKLVQENNLPPKILVVHRFTPAMVTDAEDIKPLPEVQIVMDMDGWGSPAKKKNTYQRVIYSEPVQFTGFKLFYKNDLRPPSTGMMTPEEVLNLEPKPIYIQYQ
ncbi:MAG TPA: hypothetical protein VFM02_02315 [Candidatus Paceibacterota bacterium]|nr:hypothetical protein [Candidatus Paceibacterota bacterium]